MRAILGLLVVALVLPIPVTGESAVVVAATYDLFRDIDLRALDPDTSCDPSLAEGTVEPGTIEVDPIADTLTFKEGPIQLPNVPLQEDPETLTACAMARFHFDVPNGTDHIHVRFDANRSVEQAVTLDVNMIQRLLVRSESGAVIHSIDLFKPDEPTRDRTRLVNNGIGGGDVIPLPAGTERITVVWWFQDEGREIGNMESPFSGQAFSATIWDPWIEFSGHPITQGGVRDETVRSGDLIAHQHRISFEVPGALNGPYEPSMRVRVANTFDLEAVETPDGQRIDRIGSYRSAEEYSSRLDEIKLEPREEFLQVTVPGQMVRTHGGGTYTFVFSEQEILEPESGLFAANLFLIALPLVFAGMAVHGVRAFQKEAFGQYKQTAKHLMIALALVGGYYIAVVATAAVAGWLGLMATFPIGWEAVLLYLQVVVAVAAFYSLYRTGHAMLRIVRPAADD